MNTINLFREFTEILPQLEQKQIRYAVIGGLAVNIYTQVRATKDIDFLVHEDDLVKACDAVESLGYIPKDSTIPFPKAGLELKRLLKKVDGEFLILDFLIAKTEIMKLMLSNSLEVNFSFGKLKVITKSDLVQMKKISGRPQDLVDVDNLEKS